MSNKIKGIVKFYDNNKGFGYLVRHDGEDDVKIVEDSFEGMTPKEGDEVSFTLKQVRGKPEAQELVVNDKLLDYLKANALNLKETDYDEFCDTVLQYAKRLKNANVTTSMIRKVYSRMINAKEVRELKFLRPQLAYIAGRNENNKTVIEFMVLLDELIKKMKHDNKEHLNSFKDFLEAVVAYRKFVGSDQ